MGVPSQCMPTAQERGVCRTGGERAKQAAALKCRELCCPVEHLRGGWAVERYGEGKDADERNRVSENNRLKLDRTG
uniref:Uncharacterized protein n=1 Tax=Arundo donax TaxID=35708 RepID=A0A0A8Z0A1_ARUDO